MAKKSSSSSSTKDRAKAIIDEGTDIQNRMYNLASDAIARGQDQIAAIREATSDVLSGVQSSLEKQMPSDPNNVLRQVFDGLSDAVSAAARAGEGAVNDTKARAKSVAKGEGKKFLDDLQRVEHEFFNTVSSASRSLARESHEYLDQLISRAKTAGDRIKPAAGAAISTSAKNAPELAGETLRTGARVARTLIGDAAKGLSGLFAGVSDAVKPKSPAPAAKRTARAAPSSKTPAKPAAKSTKKTTKKSARTPVKTARPATKKSTNRKR